VPSRVATVVLAAAALAGCATAGIDRSFEGATALARDRAGVESRRIDTDDEQRRIAAEVERMLASPLSVDDAVRIGVSHSPGFQALLHDGAATMSAAVQSGRPINPTFTFERLVRGDDVDIGRLLSFQVLDLLTWPWRSQMADLRVEQDRIKLAGDIVERAADVRKAWVEAVTAQQALAYYRDVLTAAEASAELARRMQGVGNFSRLQRAREQAFYAEAAVQVARAEQTQLATREALVRLLGLERAQAARLQLPSRLPDLPAAPRAPADVTQAMLEQRLDVQAAQRAVEHSARLGGLTRVGSVLGRLEVGIARNSETGEPRQRGYEIEVPIPVFDSGDALRAEARASYRAAAARVRQAIVDAHSQTNEAYGAYRTAYEVARHYRDEIVPLRKSIAEENLLRYNGMLIGVFELLADAREQVGSVIQAIEAQRAYWIADAVLANTLIGRTESVPRMFEPAPRAAGGGGAAPH
jgi:outer membrane protein TolC